MNSRTTDVAGPGHLEERNAGIALNELKDLSV